MVSRCYVAYNELPATNTRYVYNISMFLRRAGMYAGWEVLRRRTVWYSLSERGSMKVIGSQDLGLGLENRSKGGGYGSTFFFREHARTHNNSSAGGSVWAQFSYYY